MDVKLTSSKRLGTRSIYFGIDEGCPRLAPVVPDGLPRLAPAVPDGLPRLASKDREVSDRTSQLAAMCRHTSNGGTSLAQVSG